MRLFVILVLGICFYLSGCTNECGLLPADTNVVLVGVMRKDSAGNLVRWSNPSLRLKRTLTDTLFFRPTAGKYLCYLQTHQNQTSFIFEDSLAQNPTRLDISFEAQKRIVPPNCGMYFVISQIVAQLSQGTLFDSVQVRQTQLVPKDTAVHVWLYLK